MTRQTTTAAAGTYTIALLPPGVYRVTVVREGFRPIARSGVELQVNQVARLDFSMEVGAMSEKIEVVANAPLLDSDTSSLGQVIDQTRIESLPLNGRMTFRLVQLIEMFESSKVPTEMSPNWPRVDTPGVSCRPTPAF